MKTSRPITCCLLAATAATLAGPAAAPARAELGFDQSISRAVNKDIANGFLDDTMRAASHDGFPLLVPIGLAAFGGDQGRRAAALVAATGLFAYGGTQLLKLVFPRPRPYEALPDLRIKWKVDTGSSFPSSHTAVAFGIATIISEQYPELWVQCLSYSVAGVVGFSRIYLGQHYLTDVVAGAAFGYGTARGVLWLRDALGLHDALAPSPQVSWLDDGTPMIGLSWGMAPAR